MKRNTAILVIAGISQMLLAMSPPADFKAQEPILLTCAGQSADILMAKILAEKAELQFTLEQMAQPEHLKNQAALIIVSGGSTKGLGAAKIDRDEEIARVQTLIDSARQAEIKIITMHLGGKARRGKLSDLFNELAAENADCLIVVEGGNEDQYFTKIASEKDIPLFLIDKIVSAGDVLKKIFE